MVDGVYVILIALWNLDYIHVLSGKTRVMLNGEALKKKEWD